MNGDSGHCPHCNLTTGFVALDFDSVPSCLYCGYVDYFDSRFKAGRPPVRANSDATKAYFDHIAVLFSRGGNGRKAIPAEREGTHHKIMPGGREKQRVGVEPTIRSRKLQTTLSL